MMNQQRRMFRGRAGPTDSQLPKQNARRRRAPKKSGDEVRVSKYDTPYVPPAPAAAAAVVEEEVSQHDSDSEEHLGGFVGEAGLVISAAADDADESTRATQQDPSSPNTNPSKKEIRHLLRRIRNVRESMQLSTVGLADPSIYETNVLHAVTNCIVEWRAILRFYPADEVDDPVTVGLQVFETIQQALQCGPLAGGKPGYFKRCGANVASVVVNFLRENVADKEDARALYLSEKQADAVEKWKVNATKAIANDKPPSKSALKKQEKSNKSKKKG